MKKLIALTQFSSVHLGTLTPGTVFECQQNLADHLIENNLAELSEAPNDTAEPEPEPEPEPKVKPKAKTPNKKGK